MTSPTTTPTRASAAEIAEAKAAHDRAHDAYLAHLFDCETNTVGRWCLPCYDLCVAADDAGLHLSRLRNDARRRTQVVTALSEARAARMAGAV